METRTFTWWRSCRWFISRATVWGGWSTPSGRASTDLAFIDSKQVVGFNPRKNESRRECNTDNHDGGSDYVVKLHFESYGVKERIRTARFYTFREYEIRREGPLVRISVIPDLIQKSGHGCPWHPDSGDLNPDHVELLITCRKPNRSSATVPVERLYKHRDSNGSAGPLSYSPL